MTPHEIIALGRTNPSRLIYPTQETEAVSRQLTGGSSFGTIRGLTTTEQAQSRYEFRSNMQELHECERDEFRRNIPKLQEHKKF